MALLHHESAGKGSPPLVFVHGFACDHTDWRLLVEHFSPNHLTISVDLPGHGQSPGSAEACNLERFGDAVGEVMAALNLPRSVVFGHSLGARVALEAARAAPEHTAGVVLLDGSQFSAGMKPVIEERLANGEFQAIAREMFEEMFTSKSDPEVASAVIKRAMALPETIGSALLLELIRYDMNKLETALAECKVPVLALQSTYTDAQRKRSSMTSGQTSPYLETVQRLVPDITLDIIPDTGHFPQLDAPAETNASIARFLANLDG